MLTTKRIKKTSVIESLETDAKKFSFIQSVKLIECHYAHNYSTKNINLYDLINLNTPPHLESIRFSTVQNLIFPETDINSIKQIKTAKNDKWEIQVSFMGLTGPSGILPFHYSELVNERSKQKDYALKTFFDYFNHRTISLFYQSSIKYNYPIEFERHNTNLRNINDTFTNALLSLCGLGTEKIRNRMLLNDLSIAYYSGLFSQTNRTQYGLKSILSDYFKIPITIKEFTGGWCQLLDESRTNLPSKFDKKGNNTELGKTTVLGSFANIVQSKFSIHIGPIDVSNIDDFSPDSDNIKKLCELAKLYIGPEHKFDLYLKVNFPKKPQPIAFGKSENLTLGWNTWLMNKPTKKQCKPTEYTLKIK
jgi:type VI secretion system protein ImpH